MPNTRDPGWKGYWDCRKAEAKEGKAQGICLVSRRAGKIQVSAPYNLDFIPEAKALGGRWRHKSEVWTFSIPPQLVFDLCHRIYGDKVVKRGFDQ